MLWWLAGDDALSSAPNAAVADTSNEIFVSAASTWEIATKHRIRKPLIASDLDTVIASDGLAGLPISLLHGQVARALAGPHRDPFDRMLIAQAMLEGMVLVSNERVFDGYHVGRLW